MWFALGAASSVLESLQALGSSKSGSGQSGGGTFDLFGGGSSKASAGFGSALGMNTGSAPVAPETLSALIAAQGDSSTSASSSTTSSSAADPMQNLFSLLDGNGDGQISKSEFENALSAGGTNVANADSLFGKLDSNGDGTLSLDEMKSALQGGGGQHGHHHVASSDGSGDAGAGGSGGDALQALAGATTSTTANSDGSTTTTVTYADGSTMTTTTPAVSTALSAATSSYKQASTLSASAPTTAITA